MAPHVYWKGYLKLSLVTCRVALTPAVSDGERLRFHNLNRKTGNRILNQYVDAVTGKPVDADDQAKGYPRGEDDHVLFEDEEVADAGLESSRTIDIEHFVAADAVGWIWYDRPHFLTPDDGVSEEAFGVIRDAMAETATAALSRLVMYRRERAVLLVPRDTGMLLWTLHYGDELRPERPYFKEVDDSKPERAAARLMRKLIDERLQPWDPTMAADPVQERLGEIIAAKRKGRKRPKTKAPAVEPPSNVIDIMDALRKSIASERTSEKG